MPEKVRVGVVGCGAISEAYFKNAQNFPILEMAACADLNTDAAKSRASAFGVGKVLSVDELMKDKSIEIILNLTVPKAHVPVGLAAIEAGKHVFAEKPLGVTRDEGKKLMDAAAKKNLKVGCAPDTFMGAGIQTARKIIDDGTIGKPVAFTALMMSRGHESWHPNPGFYYEVGGGPMLDMGPYYLTALLQMFGPIKRIMGMASIAIPERTITHKDRQTGGPGPKFGQKIKVETPDHIVGTIEFENGAIGTIIQTFATMFGQYDRKQPITVYGTDGTLKVPDPNGFDGPVHVQLADDQEFKEVPRAFVTGYGRAVGLADMAYAVRSGRAHRASGDQAFAVLDAMQAFLDSSEQGKAIAPITKYQRTAPMRADLPFGQLDE